MKDLVVLGGSQPIAVEKTGFVNCFSKFFGGNQYVHNMQCRLCHLCACYNKEPMPIKRHITFGIPFGKEAVFPVLDMVSESSSERACK